MVVAARALALTAAFPPWDLGSRRGGAGGDDPGGTRPPTLRRLPPRLRIGLVFFGTLLTWLTNLGVAPWLLLTLIQGVFMGVLGICVAAAWRSPARILTVPAICISLSAVTC